MTLSNPLETAKSPWTGPRPGAAQPAIGRRPVRAQVGVQQLRQGWRASNHPTSLRAAAATQHDSLRHACDLHHRVAGNGRETALRRAAGKLLVNGTTARPTTGGPTIPTAPGRRGSTASWSQSPEPSRPERRTAHPPCPFV